MGDAGIEPQTSCLVTTPPVGILAEQKGPEVVFAGTKIKFDWSVLHVQYSYVVEKLFGPSK